MNSEKCVVGKLIAQWLSLIIEGSQQSCINAKKMSNGLHTRLKSKRSKPKILDHKTHIKQKKIQVALVKELPHLKDLIYSEPAITDYDWIVSDYIELYYNHFTIVVQKLCETTINV